MKLMFSAFIFCAFHSSAGAQCLSHSEIKHETIRMFGPFFPEVEIGENTFILYSGSPAIMFKENALRHPAFANCGLKWHPSDLHSVQTVGEFAQAVEWAMANRAH